MRAIVGGRHDALSCGSVLLHWLHRHEIFAAMRVYVSLYVVILLGCMVSLIPLLFDGVMGTVKELSHLHCAVMVKDKYQPESCEKKIECDHAHCRNYIIVNLV